jgi:hypothetical protein
MEREFGDGGASALWARPPEGEEMSQFCRVGIPRRTGHKVFDRYREHGPKALFDRSRPILAGFTGVRVKSAA